MVIVARVVTVNDVLDGHVVLDIECLDRIYLNAYVPILQTSSQVVAFLSGHLGFPFPSPALFRQMGDRFRRSVLSFADANDIPWIRFEKDQAKLEVMAPHLARQAGTGKSGVAAIGVAQEFQRVWTASEGKTSTGTPRWSFYKADRRVTCYYFYLWDQDFGPAFIKVCAWFPYPAKIWVNGQYAERPAMPHEAETRPVALGSRMRETAFLCRLRRPDLVACPSLWVSVSHIDGTGEIMTSEVRRIGGLRPPAEVTGPLAEHAAAFKQMLIEQGYARGTISAHLGLMSRVSRWLDVQGLPARALADLGEVDRFFAERRAKGCRLRITARSLVPLLDFLRDRQVIGAPVAPAATPAEVLLAEYRTYLEQERAAAAGTVVNFTKYAGIFLRTFPRLGTGAAQQAGLAAALGRLTDLSLPTGRDHRLRAGVRDEAARLPGRGDDVRSATAIDDVVSRTAEEDAVLVAQAFHWFDAPRALPEMGPRRLAPGELGDNHHVLDVPPRDRPPGPVVLLVDHRRGGMARREQLDDQQHRRHGLPRTRRGHPRRHGRGIHGITERSRCRRTQSRGLARAARRSRGDQPRLRRIDP